MSGRDDRVEKLLQRLDTAWTAFKESYAGLTDVQILEHGVTGDWSVRDIIAQEGEQIYRDLVVKLTTSPRS
ncbi:MAG TPA: hypothetical protein VIC60_08835 [Thermomicrobiales bacterium]